MNESKENDSRLNESASTAWVWSGLWVLFIYTTIPLARTVQEFIRDHGGKVIFLWITYAALSLGVLAVIRSVRRKHIVLSVGRSIFLALVFGVFSFLTWVLRENPEEALHFVQYGVLSLLLFRALRHHISDVSIFFCAAMIGTFFGIIDEIIQWITPRRFFDFRDIGINVIAVLLVQLALAFGIRSDAVRGSAGRLGKQLSFSICALNLAVVLLCLSNTPQFIDHVHENSVVAGWLKEPMAEYGYLHIDPDIGRFKSRLALAELKRQDKNRYEEVIPVLHESWSDDHYYRLISQRPAHMDPLMVESRVHLFRRDRYASRFNDPDDKGDKAYYATVAWYENRIMEKYFPHILTNSLYHWPPGVRAVYEEHAEMHNEYHSAVSKALITAASLNTFRITLGLLIVLSLLGSVSTHRCKRS